MGDLTVDFEPRGRRVLVEPDTSLLEAARLAEVGLSAVCGGAGTCDTCRVRIAAGEVTPPTEREQDAVAEGYRLACECRALSDVRVDVPPSSITAPQRAQIEGLERPVEGEPVVSSYEVAMEPPGLTDLRADTTRLVDALRTQHGVTITRVHDEVMGELPAMARENDWRLRAVSKGRTVIAVMPPEDSPLGLAVDIGTTKLAGYLADLSTGDILAAAGIMNPQIAYGDDVVARITYAMESESNRLELQSSVVGGLNELVAELCAVSSRQSDHVTEAVLVGNTCIHHLVLGLPVDSLGMAPYVPVLADPIDLRASQLGLDLGPGAEVHLLPNIAGFVGADHVAMILAAGIHETDAVTVGLDIGTNTEIVLAANGKLLSCSCASGPAFEGAHIKDGMRAAPGAVERIRLSEGADGSPEVEYQTVDDAAPAGICGSGIVDGVAELLRCGVLRATGSMQEGSHPRVRRVEAGLEFLLVPAGEREAQRDIVIARKDVAEIQLAMAAIRTGIEILLTRAGLGHQDIERVLVAGAFGTYLDVDSAMAIGMFPRLPRSHFVQVGNAAGMGAKMSLLSRSHRASAATIADSIEYIELAADPGFSNAYTAAIMMPVSE